MDYISSYLYNPPSPLDNMKGKVVLLQMNDVMKTQTELSKYFSNSLDCTGVSLVFSFPNREKSNMLITFVNKADADKFMTVNHTSFKSIICDEVLWNVEALVRRELVKTIDASGDQFQKLVHQSGIVYERAAGSHDIVSGLVSSLRQFEKMLLESMSVKLGASAKEIEVFENCTALVVPWVTASMSDGMTSLKRKLPKITDSLGQVKVVGSSLDEIGRIEKKMTAFVEAASPTITQSDALLNDCLEELLNVTCTLQTNKIFLIHRDITKQSVDVIVNSSNPKLCHDGGLALALVRTGGASIQRESDEFIARNGPLPPGGVCYTSAGNLECDHIVHVVAPRWNPTNEEESEKLLRESLMNTLHCASSIGARSLATPIISSGVYGFPVKVCARVFRTTLEEFSKKEGATTSLRDIRIVNNNAETQKEFIDEFTTSASSVAEANLHRRKRTPADTVINMEGVNTSDEDFTTPAQLKSNRNEDDGCFVSMESDEYSRKRRKAHTSMTGPKSTYFPPATTTTTSILSSPNSNASSKPNTVSPAPTTAAIASQSGRGDCPICVDDDVPLMSMKCCQNTICNNCFARHFDTDAKCPFCTLVVLMKKGNQPPGTMDCSIDECSSLPGYEGMGIIIITYHFPNGIQKEHHPNPGVYYSGTSRRAYLPANKEGRQVLELLQRGFDQKVLFTIGKSVTTGQDNCVLWNDVHHKTNTRGGPAQYGYPDPTYLSRVKGELAAKGIK